MDIHSIEAFLAVSETGSFSRAADTLFLSQPAISKRIQTLEHTLDITLFDRVGKSVRLTEAGHALLPSCRRIIEQIEEGKRIISNLRQTTSGVLKLATSHHIGLHRLPPVLYEFASHYPDVDLELNFMDSEQACEQIINGDIELAVVTLPDRSDQRLEMTPVWDDPLRIIVSKRHPLSAAKSVSIKRLLQVAAILPSRGTYTRRLIDEALGLDESVHTLLETHYLETIKAMVQAGLGWSMLPLSMLDDSLVTLDISQGRATRQLGCVVHSMRTKSNAANAMIRLLTHFSTPA
ncbi:MAG: LysR family transcriptional regulator [Thiotrichales bacterium]|nr:MAG: LysR family transcriptional regulator [Thiotrichales bacterium]